MNSQPEEAAAKKATLIRNSLPKFRGDAALYKCDPPLPGYEGDSHEYVIASGVFDDFGGLVSVPIHECYLFPASPDGFIADWGELPGSIKDTTSHAEAFASVGYEVIS